MRLSYSPSYSANSFQNIICWKSCVPSVGLSKWHSLDKGLSSKRQTNYLVLPVNYNWNKLITKRGSVWCGWKKTILNSHSTPKDQKLCWSSTIQASQIVLISSAGKQGSIRHLSCDGQTCWSPWTIYDLRAKCYILLLRCWHLGETVKFSAVQLTS